MMKIIRNKIPFYIYNYITELKGGFIMAEKNRTCIVCQTKYRWCGNCSDNANQKETWRHLYCSKNCMKIFNILSEYTFKHIDEQQAKNKLKDVDLSKLDGFRKDFKDQIKQIQSSSAPAPAPDPTPAPAQPQPQKQEQNKPNKEIVKPDFKK